MKKTKLIIFFSLLSLYIFGVFIGGICQVKSGSQSEMYNYLTGAVAASQTSIPKSIVGVAKINAAEFLILAICALLRPAMLLLPVLMTVKGCAVGFSLTCALRSFGAKGLILCAASLFSVMITVPCIAYCGCCISEKFFSACPDKKFPFKKYIFIFAFVFAIFLADTFMRGTLSALFVKLSQTLTKSA